MDEQDMFSGLVYCADCGSTMTLSRAHTMKESQYNFTCQNHRKNGKDVCSPHYIRESILAAVVLDDVRRITHFARQNEVLFAKHIGMKRSKESQREIAALQKRIEVGEREKKYSRNAPQDITIYYRDVGAMDELPQQRAEEEESAKNSQEIA